MAPNQDAAPADGNAGEQPNSPQQATQHDALELFYLSLIRKLNRDRHLAAAEEVEAYEAYCSAQWHFHHLNPEHNEIAALLARNSCTAAAIILRGARDFRHKSFEAYQRALECYRLWQEGLGPEDASDWEASQGSSSAPDASPQALPANVPIANVNPREQPPGTPSNATQGSGTSSYGSYGSWLVESVGGVPAPDEADSAHSHQWQLEDANSRACPEALRINSPHTLEHSSYQSGVPLDLRCWFLEHLAERPGQIAPVPQQTPCLGFNELIENDTDVMDFDFLGYTDDESFQTSDGFSEPNTPDVIDQAGDGLDNKSESECEDLSLLEEQQADIA